MNTDSLRFKKFIKLRVEPKKCPIHNKSVRISVNRMEFTIGKCCCEEFKKALTNHCNKYKYGILSGRYNFSPKRRLR